MRKLMVVLMVAVLGAGALGACSDDADDARASTTEPGDATGGGADDGAGEDPPAGEGEGEGEGEGGPAPEPGRVLGLDAWADEFCTSFVAWLDDREANLEGIDTTVAVTDYPAQQAALEAFYEGEAEAAGALVERLEQGSVPNLDGGDELVAELTSLFVELGDAASTAAEAAAALDSSSASFEADGQQLNLEYQSSLEATGDRFLAIAEDYPGLAENATLEERCVG